MSGKNAHKQGYCWQRYGDPVGHCGGGGHVVESPRVGVFLTVARQLQLSVHHGFIFLSYFFRNKYIKKKLNKILYIKVMMYMVVRRCDCWRLFWR